MQKCGATNEDLIAYEEPREGNSFETTVYAFEEGEAKCERPANHKGRHGFVHRKTNYVMFKGINSFQYN